jgi:hypothetical protein
MLRLNIVKRGFRVDTVDNIVNNIVYSIDTILQTESQGMRVELFRKRTPLHRTLSMLVVYQEFPLPSTNTSAFHTTDLAREVCIPEEYFVSAVEAICESVFSSFKISFTTLALKSVV